MIALTMRILCAWRNYWVKMKKRIWFALIVSLLLVTLVSAKTFYFTQNEERNFYNGCFDEITGEDCDSTFSCYLTSSYPNGTLLFDNSEMSRTGVQYNITFTSSQTAVNGEYVSKQVCSNGTEGGFEEISIIVNPNGEETTTSAAVFYIGLLALLIIGFGFIAYFGITKENIMVRTFSLGFGYLFLIAITFVSWNMAADFLYTSPFFVSFLYYLFLVLMIGFFPFLLILFAWGIYMAITIKEIKSMIDRGVPESEAAERVRWRK